MACLQGKGVNRTNQHAALRPLRNTWDACSTCLMPACEAYSASPGSPWGQDIDWVHCSSWQGLLLLAYLWPWSLVNWGNCARIRQWCWHARGRR